MARASGDDRDAIDRAFAEMIAGYHLTADPPDGRDPENPDRHEADHATDQSADRGTDRSTEHSTDHGTDHDQDPAKPEDPARSGHGLDLDNRWADEHPLFSYTPPPPRRDDRPASPPDDDTFDPGPPPPWPRPSAAVLIGWIGVSYAVVAMIAAALGAPVPRWAGWMAVGSFVAGFALLLSRLPRQRPPDSGDGAVL